MEYMLDGWRNGIVCHPKRIRTEKYCLYGIPNTESPEGNNQLFRYEQHDT